MFEKIKKHATESNETFIQKMIPRIKTNQAFVSFAKDSTPEKIHIKGFSYNIFSYTYASNNERTEKVSAGINSNSVFDIYFDPYTQQIYFKHGFILTQPESVKKLFETANKKLQQPDYYYKKINYLKKKIQAEQMRIAKESEKQTQNDEFDDDILPGIAMAAMSCNSL